jgi:hypothetical protein
MLSPASGARNTAALLCAQNWMPHLSPFARARLSAASLAFCTWLAADRTSSSRSNARSCSHRRARSVSCPHPCAPGQDSREPGRQGRRRTVRTGDRHCRPVAQRAHRAKRTSSRVQHGLGRGVEWRAWTRSALLASRMPWSCRSSERCSAASPASARCDAALAACSACACAGRSRGHREFRLGKQQGRENAPGLTPCCKLTRKRQVNDFLVNVKEND